MRFAARRLSFAAVALLLGAASVHCGSTPPATGDTESFGNNGLGGAGTTTTGAGGLSGYGGSGGAVEFDAGGVLDASQDAFYENDPPPETCNADAGATPPVIGGTPECPDDKNLPGCTCGKAGDTAPCWTGMRKDRHHGVCKDGTTTCSPTGEAQRLEWGECQGEVLPTPGATEGKAACECFSAGHWTIDNLSPCFYEAQDANGNVVSGAISTIMNGNQPACPQTFDAAPGQPWSTDSLKVDCTGYFKLCYTIKAGDAKNPQANDCAIVQSCTEGYYGKADTVEPLPPLAGWISDAAASACVEKFKASGGYGEMSVAGTSDLCEKVAKVFLRVPYCPLSCAQNPNDPACKGCQYQGGGNF
jgi:hypothetical protein